MRIRANLALIACTVAAAALAAPAQAASGAAAALSSSCGGDTHCYDMNEGPGAGVMRDTGKSPVNGTIGSEVKTGVSFGGGVTGYTFPRLAPSITSPHPEHLVTIPDSASVDPGDRPYTITIRYRTTNAFGNLIQKGQSATAGGQFKIQLPKGRPSCYFKGSSGRVGIGWSVAINDGRWHTLVCTRTADRVTLSVDGARARVKNGVSGTLNNSSKVTIAGKSNCDQIKTTCDYFGGDVDFVSLSKG